MAKLVAYGLLSGQVNRLGKPNSDYPAAYLQKTGCSYLKRQGCIALLADAVLPVRALDCNEK
jgi:hypothetical protein